MNGAHDMGGMHGFGPIDPEPEAEEPVFHHDWERRIMALNLAAGAMGRWNIDMSRFARESQPPVQYLSNSYYQTWLAGLEKLLVQTGLVSESELSSCRSEGQIAEDLAERVLTAEQVPTTLGRGDSFRMDDEVPAKFEVGDTVRVKNRHPDHHTRAPRYVRGHVGVVDRDHGVFVFADENAKGMGNRVPQHVYGVRFSARELWGPEASARDCVYADLWDGHLEPA
ncbi:MAG: nitrile hydratase subunit beta [Alphaproteobacteria bacterium]|jgi:nitrile hydratase|nr:nitrile hydratase subunit beta [Alphaproteobacteria bacterium]MDP6815379.1 nitrile hydratase subunit beta [Alphaproteobacteria bacterium]